MIRSLRKSLGLLDEVNIYEEYFAGSPVYRRASDKAKIRELLPLALLTAFVISIFAFIVTALIVLTNETDPNVVRHGLAVYMYMNSVIGIVLAMPWLNLALFRRRLRQYIMRSIFLTLEASERSH